MNDIEKFQVNMDRLSKRAERISRQWDHMLERREEEYRKILKDIEDKKKSELDEFQTQEERLKGELDSAAKEFTRQKYLVERDKLRDEDAAKRAQDLLEGMEKQTASELRRINEDRVNTQISYDRQKSALLNLYQEKRRSMLVQKEKLIQDAAKASESLKTQKVKFSDDMEKVQSENGKRLQDLKDQLEAKKQGWDSALESIRRDRETMAEHKREIEQKLASVQSDKEKELESARAALLVAKEQLELDKVTIVEKAEEDQRICEAQATELQASVAKNEVELQDLLIHRQQELKDAEESFLKEEAMLKEAVKMESEKRDYEQKLYLQEKSQKEAEVKRLQEEYEKKKNQWENQIRTLTIQKSVQDAEHEAERMRVDREARTILRGLEAKRDELKQRLSDIKSRYEGMSGHYKKEQDLLQQRWNWRKERLWSMWQSRLEVLKKERSVIHEQLEELEKTYLKCRADYTADASQGEKRITDLQDYSLQSGERNDATRKQREIQLELEKTRIIAQIKECEGLITDWMARQKSLQDEVSRKGNEYSQQFGFLDRLYREEQQEAELFLHSFQKALSTLQGILEDKGISKKAA